MQQLARAYQFFTFKQSCTELHIGLCLTIVGIILLTSSPRANKRNEKGPLSQEFALESLPTTPSLNSSNTPPPKLPLNAIFMTDKRPEIKGLIKLKEALASNGIHNIDVNTLTGSIILSFRENIFKKGDYQLDDATKLSLKKIFPILIGEILKIKNLKASLKKFKIAGISGHPSESYQLPSGKRTYNKKLAYQRAQSVYRYLFNVENVDFKYQDFILQRTSLSGNGLRFLARENTPAATKDYLAYYCQFNNCEGANRILFKLYVDPQGE